MKKQRGNFEWIIIVVAILICCSFLLVPFKSNTGVSAQEKEAKAYLKQEQSLQHDQVLADINAANEQIELMEGNLSSDDLYNKFKNAYIIGDSIPEGLVVYQVLPESAINSMRGKRVDNMDDQLDMAKQKQPKYLFMCYGMNDLYYYNGNVDGFIKVYGDRIDEIKKALPNTEIFVNLITPIRYDTIAQSADLQHYDTFNKELMAMCKKKKIKAIDNQYIIDNLEDPYEFDGIHPKYKFYPLWAENMAKAAGL